MVIKNISCHFLVGCRDDDVILSAILRNTEYGKYSDIKTCKRFKDSNYVWQSTTFQPKTGPGDTWANWCKSAYSEFFNSNIDTFPCGKTCGFCKGMYTQF